VGSVTNYSLRSEHMTSLIVGSLIALSSAKAFSLDSAKPAATGNQPTPAVYAAAFERKTNG
jgi:hypothetical protein